MIWCARAARTPFKHNKTTKMLQSRRNSIRHVQWTRKFCRRPEWATFNSKSNHTFAKLALCHSGKTNCFTRNSNASPVCACTSPTVWRRCTKKIIPTIKWYSSGCRISHYQKSIPNTAWRFKLTRQCHRAKTKHEHSCESMYATVKSQVQRTGFQSTQ